MRFQHSRRGKIEQNLFQKLHFQLYLPFCTLNPSAQQQYAELFLVIQSSIVVLYVIYEIEGAQTSKNCFSILKYNMFNESMYTLKEDILPSL